MKDVSDDYDDKIIYFCSVRGLIINIKILYLDSILSHSARKLLYVL